MPKAYDEFFVPRLFEPWAQLLLDEVRLRPGNRVLDVATGPGTVARLAAQRVGPSGRISAADIAEPMLEIARSKPHPTNAAPIEYLQSPAAPLRLRAPHLTFSFVRATAFLRPRRAYCAKCDVLAKWLFGIADRD